MDDLLERKAARILANPCRVGFIKSALRDLEVGSEAVWLEALINRARIPHRLLVLALAERIGDNEARVRLASLLATALDKEPYRSMVRVYEAFLTGQEPSSEDADTVRSSSLDNLEFFFKFMRPDNVIVDVIGENVASPSVSHDSDIGHISALLRRFLDDKGEFHPEWDKAVAPLRSKPARARKLAFNAEKNATFADLIIERGGVAMPDPGTGHGVTCCDSVVLSARVCYTFRGSEPWFLITGTAFNVPIIVYYPQRGVIFCVSSILRAVKRSVDMMPRTLAHLLHRFTLLVREQPLGPIGPAGPILIVGTIGNPAHHLWNFLSGIERLRISGRLPKVSRVLYGGTEFFGRLDEIFPEIQGRIEHPANPLYLDPSPMDPDRLLVGVGGYFIPRTLTDRIIALMKVRPRRGAHLEPADLQIPPTGRVVWIGLRLGNKAWIGQETGIPAIVDAISCCFPGSVFVLDGYSYPVGIDLVSNRWLSVIAELHRSAECIKANCSPGNRVINAVGNTFREAVLWADACDVYFAPFGSAQHKVGWFSRRPGIAYVGPDFGARFVEMSPACLASEISATPDFIYGQPLPGNKVVEGSRANMQLDTALIIDRLIAHLSAWCARDSIVR